MKDFYLYGGGINALAVCDFFRQSHIKAVIDRDEALWGQKIRGIPIISFEDYQKEEQGEAILIAAYDAQEAIINDFEKKGVRNYFRSPWMQSEFYRDRQDVISFHKLDELKKIVFFQFDPISEYIAEALQKKGVEIGYIDKGDSAQGSPIVISTNEKEETIDRLTRDNPNSRVIVLNGTKRNDSYDYSVLRKFKGAYKGRRCFLVGNGPSVTYKDLDRLYKKKEICFGVNSIYKAFEHTLWRPDFYVAVDQYFIEEKIGQVNAMKGIKFFRHLEYAKTVTEGETYDVHLIPSVVAEHNFSFDIEEGVYSGSTVLYDALQIAVYMGFSEIYLLGADMSVGLLGNSEGKHFYGAEQMKIPIGVWDPTSSIEIFGEAHVKLKERGIKFENATRNVWWDNVPRTSFDRLLNQE
ncbi:Protein of unknown function DUF115 [Lachnospiraceae bacterium C10]|nr:Protein of unknown function DUF115 [Lachnospiraceae bacterium C10]